MHSPRVAPGILLAALAAFLFAPSSAMRARAAQSPAFYSNMIMDFNTGKPVFVQTPDGDVSGRLYDLAPGDRRILVVPSRVAAPLAAYTGVLDADRNATDSSGMLRALGAAAAIEPLSMPYFENLLQSAPDQAPQSGPAPPFGQSPQDQDGDRQDRKIKFDIRGYRYIKFRQYSSSGDSQTFLSQNGLFTYGDTIEQGTSLQISAKRDDIELSGTINELPLQERDLAFDILYGAYGVKLGDFNSEFKGGTLASLNKRITGAEILYESPKYDFGFVSSQARSQPRTISFNGNNTHGPYDLNTFEIVAGSAQVLLNGQPMPEHMYDLDYYAGQISFCSTTLPPKCTPIKTSDTVQVTFEQKLLLSLTAGNLQGFSGAYKLPGQKGKIGMAWLTQEANRAAQSARRNNTETFSGAQLLAQGATEEQQRIIFLDPPNSRFTSAGLEFIVRNTVTVHRNGQLLDPVSDFSIPYRGYASGRIDLAQTPSTADSFTVNYSYYVDDFINVSQQEEIRETGDIVFTLQRSQVFAGSEVVHYCTNPTCTGPDLLSPGPAADYEIDETNNTLIIHSVKRPNEIDGAFLQITYYYVPSEAPEATDFDHTVRNIFGAYKIGGNTSIEFESATSNSDAAKTPIQVMNEVVARPAADITCPATLTPAPECQYILANTKIEENSESIRINNNPITLRRGADYTLDADTSRLTFTGGVTIPAGAVVYANYRYNPDIDLGLVTGNATRLTATTKLRNISLTVSKHGADPFFAPIGGNTTLETSRLDTTLSFPVSETLTIDAVRSKFKTAEDIYETHNTTTRDNTTRITWSPGGRSWLQSAAWSFGGTDTSDDRPTPATDNTRRTRSLEFDILVPKFKNMKFNTSFGSEQYTDNTALTDNTKSSFSNMALSYKPRNELSLDLTIQKTGVDSTGPTGNNSSANTARSMLLTWQPVPLITLTADINSQHQANSSADIEDTTIDTTTVRLTTLPFWRIRVFTYGLTQQDRPSQFTGGTQSNVQNVSFTTDAGNGVSITPTHTISSSSSAYTSSKTTLDSIRVEYLPAEQPWEASLLTETSGTSSLSSTAAQSNTDTNRLSWDLKYKFTPYTSILYRNSNNSTTHRSETISTNSEQRHTFQFEHQVQNKWVLRASYILFDRSAVFDTSERNLEINSEYRLSEILFWNFNYRIIGYDSPQRPETSHDGQILETELRLQF
jgi:hypothetical protein